MSVHVHTPQIAVIDGRGLPVRQIAYWRQDDSDPEPRHTVQQHDSAGRRVAQRDPRLAAANLTTIYSLSGQVLSTLSVDAGWRAQLPGEEQQPVLGWDDRGSQRRVEYDKQLRPTGVFEQALAGESLCAERCVYGASDPAFATRNQCGRLIRHDDPAGTQLLIAFGLTGAVLEQTRHFLQALDSPDWPELMADRDALVEPGVGAISQTVVNPQGEVIQQTDAKGNRQCFTQTPAGELHEVRLQLKNDTAPKTLVSAIHYNAQGLTEQETAGNGVITTLQYDPEDGRLTRLHAQRGSNILQDLHYVYDPVGNVLRTEDAALPIRYFSNQRIEPVNRYGYDSLYQLIKATGWEAGMASQGPQFSAFDDPQACAGFTQTYRYDRGGNLLELTHEGPQNHGHRLVAATRSNRCLPVLDDVEPDEKDFRNSFDANGNLLALQPGQSLQWDLRNQLREVRPVERDNAADDSEQYRYGADGMRLRKVRSTRSNARTLVAEVRYLPNLEIRTRNTGEVLQVIRVQAGRNSVQVLHWESELPKDITNDQQRYSLSDHLGSCTLELDSAGQVISHERYHPFGTTAWFAGREEVEASYKRLRYSGKERDCTGLYYYGFRYYAAWLQRWLNPDPAGVVDGLNRFAMVGNSPLTYFDIDGQVREKATRENPPEEALGFSPLSLSTTPFSATSTSSTRFAFPETPPTSPESASKTHSIETLLKNLQLDPERPKQNFTSVADDIGGHPQIAGGGEGEIYESLDGKNVYKKYRGFNKEESIPGSVISEAESFNAYYGPGSATAILDNNQVYLKMIKLEGVPLNKLDENAMPAGAALALYNMFDEMETKDLFHQDVQDHNFLFSAVEKKVYPVDMVTLPYEFAQYTIDIYNSKKISLIERLATNVKN